MEKKAKKIALLIGRGGRLKAVYNCAESNPLVDLTVVVSHKKESLGVDWARERGFESAYFRLSDWKGTRKSYETALAEFLIKRKINLIVMVGWDLVMSDNFLKYFPNRVINIHPALCPAFPGQDAEKQALNYGVKYTGCTLHFVDEGVDTGPIILQRVVEIKPSDTVGALQKRIHKKEEELLCGGIKLFAEERLKIKGRKVFIKE